MKLIIAGKRDMDVTELWIDQTLGYFFPGDANPPEEIVSGGATGIDTCGELTALYYDIPIKNFLADWETHGKAAGPIRNREMTEYGDALLLIWDGKSRGSAYMKKEMEKLGKPVYEVILKSPEEDL